MLLAIPSRVFRSSRIEDIGPYQNGPVKDYAARKYSVTSKEAEDRDKSRAEELFLSLLFCGTFNVTPDNDGRNRTSRTVLMSLVLIAESIAFSQEKFALYAWEINYPFGE